MAEILITGFEMPPKDDTYGLHLVIYPNGDVWIAYDDKPTGMAKELPTHGDFIDRQETRKQILKDLSKMKINLPSDVFGFIIDRIDFLLTKAPTILEATV